MSTRRVSLTSVATSNVNASQYLTLASASSTYLTQAAGLTAATAASTYATKTELANAIIDPFFLSVV